MYSTQTTVLLSTKIHKIVQYQNHVHELIGDSRQKRAPLEFIGQLSKILFGTITTEDAYHINSAIMHVENKTNDLASLLINQTSATRIYFGELYDATSKIQSKLSNLSRHVNENINELNDKYIQNNIRWYFEDIIESIEHALVEHEIDLNILIDGILFGKQGLIHPRMISPSNLIQNFKLIREQIPNADFPIPINEKAIDKLISISHLQIAYAHNRLIYVLHIPLLTPGRYTLYKPLPLPTREEFDVTKFAVIEPSVGYVALNEDAGSFYLFQEEELKECIAYDKTYICSTTFPLHKLRETPNCNVELLLNRRILSTCKIVMKELNSVYWKALTMAGTWIFSTPTKETISIECSKYTKQETINDSGIITIQRGCKINTKAITIAHPSIRKTETLQYYMPLNNLSILNLYQPVYEKYNVKLTEATHELWQLNHSNIEATFDDIIKKAEQIKNRKTQEWRTIVHNTLVYAIGLLSTFFVITYFFLLSPWGTCVIQQLCKKQKNRPPMRNQRQGDMHLINISEETPGAQSNIPSGTDQSATSQ